jgi:hypothetical protein
LCSAATECPTQRAAQATTATAAEQTAEQTAQTAQPTGLRRTAAGACTATQQTAEQAAQSAEPGRPSQHLLSRRGLASQQLFEQIAGVHDSSSGIGIHRVRQR